MADNQQNRRSGGISEGIRSGIGILTAFVEAVEGTFQEAVDRGDLSPDRARQVVREAATRFQEGIGEARERMDLVPRPEFDDLRTEVVELRRRVQELEAQATPRPSNGDDVIPVDEG